MKKCLIIGITLLVICLGLTIYRELINASINIYDITNSGLKEENKRVYLDATFVAGTINGSSDDSFYVMFGDGVQYIVWMNNKKANEINNFLLDNPEESYKIVGITKEIPTSLEEDGKKFVKEWLDHNHNHENEEVEENHTHDITTDEFYHYFGYVYLDSNNNFDYLKIIIYLTGIVGVLFIINYTNTKYHLL